MAALQRKMIDSNTGGGEEGPTSVREDEILYWIAGNATLRVVLPGSVAVSILYSTSHGHLSKLCTKIACKMDARK